MKKSKHKKEVDPKRQPITIDAKGLPFTDRVRMQMKALHDYLEAEMPEHGWMYNKSAVCEYDDMPEVFAKCSALYAEYAEEYSAKETHMFLRVSVLHPAFGVCHNTYKMSGNKQKILAYLSDDSNVEIIEQAILWMSNQMKERDYH